MADLKPTTLFLGAKAYQLFSELANENQMARKFFLTKIIVREARAEATGLTADKLKARLQLIDEVNDELVDAINNPPKTQLADRDYSTDPKRIYQKIWEAHRRLRKRGMSEEYIHDYCLDMYGMDFKIKKTPTKNPKRNPDWVGGGPVAQKIKDAQEVSRKIEVE